MEKKTENYRHGPDGTLLVKKIEPLRIGGFDTILSGREVWFPCSQEDPDRQYRKMVLGGWFGYHKFQEKKGRAGAGPDRGGEEGAVSKHPSGRPDIQLDQCHAVLYSVQAAVSKGQGADGDGGAV